VLETLSEIELLTLAAEILVELGERALGDDRGACIAARVLAPHGAARKTNATQPRRRRFDAERPNRGVERAHGVGHCSRLESSGARRRALVHD